MIKKSSIGWYFLGAIFVLGIFLRVYNIPNTLLFHLDQGYHGLAIKEIWENKRIALLGHRTDAEGIFHGSFFYYFMLPLYLVSRWNPAGVSILLAALDSFSIFFIFLIGKNLFDENIGLVAALFYATSYSLISYSRWLSNVTPIPFFSTVFFYLLIKSYKDNLWFFPFACLFLGLITQFNGAIGFFFLPPLIFFFYLLRKEIFKKKRYLLTSVVFFLLPILPLIFFDLRHNFLVSRSILRLFSGFGGSFDFNIYILKFSILKTEIVNLLSYKFPLITFTLLTLTVWAIWQLRFEKKEFKQVKILLVMLLIPFLTLFAYPEGISGFFIVGILPLFILFFSWGVWNWGKKKIFRSVTIILVFFIIFLNLYHWQGFLRPGFNLIPIGTRNLITLGDRIKAVDFMYQKSDGKLFRTIIYIIPYFQEEPWDYVFSWYGKPKYGYLPNSQAAKTFVIYEPDYDFPYRLDDWLVRIEKDHGKVISSFKTHDLTVEEREK